MNIKDILIKSTVALALAAPLAQAGHHGDKSKMTMGKNIVETAAAAGQFETLIAAAKAAGLVGALTGDGPLTVFAPTDEAFAALPEGTVESLLKPENKDQLARILKFHVIAGRVESSALADGVSIDTLAGPKATIAASEGGFTIEGARIVATDIGASNGIVHVIDRVILPPAKMGAVDLIDRAIERGVPMFNHGQAGATVAVYSIAAESLIAFAGDELTNAQERRLQDGLRQAQNSHDQRTAAWRLRYALDDVRSSLTGEMMTIAQRMSR